MRVGIDLVRVADIAQSLSQFGERYVARVFTDGERSDCDRDPAHRLQRLAARFAAKEAALKVLRPRADQAIPWRSIEVQRAGGGWPELRLHGPAAAAAAEARLAELSLSMSHEGDWATAVVVGHRVGQQGRIER